MAVYEVFVLRRDVLLHCVQMWCLLVWAVTITVTLCNFTINFIFYVLFYMLYPSILERM